ncbi:cytochrome c [Crateriforma spongiae]|uniref:cytochrome c n=1 Tax=Crateriforma spongiae TaxID=2724528 RepID=UPI0014482555|nr:cytochrome c [Crateriforma spongiae]
MLTIRFRRPMRRPLAWLMVPAILGGGIVVSAPPPDFDPDEVRSVFFESLDDAIRGQRPKLGEMGTGPSIAKSTATDRSADSGNDDGKSVWNVGADAVSLEDEIKRVRLRFEQGITTPGAFRSGGYQDARLDLTVLATWFAVINEFEGDVRWKDDAAVARDVLARTARNTQSGTIQVYNEVKKRAADLQDLVSGSGLAAAKADPDNDWATIADRVPLMTYAEQLLDDLSDATSDVATAKEEAELVSRNADLIALLGVVLTREGLDEADDPDYVELADAMTDAARSVKQAIRQDRLSDLRSAVGEISKTCANCHEQYR